MPSDSISVGDASGGNNSYDIVGRDLTSSRRIESTTNISEPTYLDVSHRETGKGLDVVNTFESTVKVFKRINGVLKFASVKIVVSRPVDPVFTDTIMKDAFANNVGFCAEGLDDTGLMDPNTLISLMNGQS